MTEIDSFRELVNTVKIVLEGEQSELSEASVQTAPELAGEIIKVHNKYFPNSYIHSEYSRNISPSIMVKIALSSSKKEAPYNILDNDPAITQFAIHLKGSVDEDDSTLTGPITVERFRGIGLAWNYPGGFEKVKIPFRKTTGDPQKILKAFDRYFSRLRDAVKENADALNDVLPFKIKSKVR